MANKAKNTETFSFAKWTVEVHRRPLRRSVAIHLYPQRPIKVMAGTMTTHKDIYGFLLSKKGWIEKSFHRFEQIAEKFPRRKVQAYQAFPFLGKDLDLRLAITVLSQPFVAIQGTELRLYIPQNQWRACTPTEEHPQFWAVIRDFYKREAIKRISERVLVLAEQMKVQPQVIKFREQKTRWGSCSSRGNLNFNWRLIVFKSEIIDYVIVHELSHLIHMNHSACFWKLVERHCPQYELHMKELRENQNLCEFLTPQY